MKILAIAAAAVFSASALQASDFEIKVSDLKNIPVPAPRLAPIMAAPVGSWNTVDANVKQFFFSWKQGKPVSGTMLIQTNASCAKPNAGAPRHDIVVEIPNSGLTVSFPSSNGVPVVLTGGAGETVTIPGGLTVTIPGNPPIDLSNQGAETVVSIPGAASGGLVVSIPGPSIPTVTFPVGPASKLPRVRVACGVNTVNPNPHY